MDDLLGRGLETDDELLLCLVHLNVIAVGLQSVGQHLQPQFAVGDVVDGGPAIGIGLELRSPRVSWLPSLRSE